MRASSDLASGLILAVLGVAVALYSYLHYELGSLSRMGPGFFPVALGGLLAVIGSSIILFDLISNVKSEAIRPILFRPLLAVCGSIFVFGLSLESLGLLPATLFLTLFASASVSGFSYKRSFIIGISLAILSWGIFVLGLDMPISLIKSFRQ